MRKLAAALLTACATPALAGTNGGIFFQVPTLDEYGLIGLIVAVGAAAGYVVRRKAQRK